MSCYVGEEGGMEAMREKPLIKTAHKNQQPRLSL
jgi:hypothetical protein